jgi:GH15 family glucan-1,4-alpha-glucosidase
MPYLPIDHYGVIGDLHTVALCGVNGSIDWFCFPHFDSPSVFGALLDDKKGGRFKIAPVGEGVTVKQLYIPDSNVLITRFLSADGVGEITDFMPVAEGDESVFRHRLVRIVQVVPAPCVFGSSAGRALITPAPRTPPRPRGMVSSSAHPRSR